ncbi:MAG: DUF6605 domain-containing protein [Candidatus Nanopelagicales bacterium]
MTALLVALALAACSNPGHGPTTTTAPSSVPSATSTPVDRPTGTTATWTYASSYDVAAPTDAAPRPVVRCTAAGGADWLARERRLPGTSGWRRADPMLAPRVTLYPDRPSTGCGAPVDVHLGGRGGRDVVVRAYRMGWYAGAGARLVWSSKPVDVPRAAPAPVHDRRVPSPRWTTTVRLPVGSAWPPGLYLLVAEVHGRPSGEAGLVVRDDAAAAPAAVVYSNLTWTAYSLAGGASLYRGSSGRSDTRALSAAVQRPLMFHSGSPLLTYDVPVAQLLDRAGVAADPLVDTDVDTWPSMLVHRTEVVLPGHSEYWTRTMFDALTAARNAGANVADLGANDMYWHARVEYDATHVPVSMFVARTVALDPLAHEDPTAATVQWRHAPLLRNPSAVVGQSYTAVRARGGLQVRSVPQWLEGVRGFVAGAVLPHAAWNEVNGIRPGAYPVPDNVQVLAQGVLLRAGFDDQPVSTTYYSTRSGGAVFDAGSTYWPCLVMRACEGFVIGSPERATLWQVMQRVLVGFQTPSFGALHPSQPTRLPGVSTLRTSLPAAAVGTYGLGD